MGSRAIVVVITVLTLGLVGGVVAVLSAGSSTSDVDEVDLVAGVELPSTALPDSAVTTADVDEPYDLLGFVECGSAPHEASLSARRRQDIVDAYWSAEIGNGIGDDEGFVLSVSLFVLDQGSLEQLSAVAAPHEVCVTGQHPDDYVSPGPQLGAGPGWRWLGSGGADGRAFLDLLTDQESYDALWGEYEASYKPPGVAQPHVDFIREAVLVIQSGGAGVAEGTMIGPCQRRFEGIEIVDDVVVVKMFRPGGDHGCVAVREVGTYMVAVDLSLTGPPPFEVGVRDGPRERAHDFVIVPTESADS